MQSTDVHARPLTEGRVVQPAEPRALTHHAARPKVIRRHDVQLVLTWSLLALGSLVAADAGIRLLSITRTPSSILVGVLWVTLPFALGIFARSVLDAARAVGSRSRA